MYAWFARAALKGSSVLQCVSEATIFQMAALGNKLVLCCFLLAVARRAVGQDLLIGNWRPCQDPGSDPDPDNPTDNLSCPRLDSILQCYPLSQLCNRVQDCDGGSDEGSDLVALECSKLSASHIITCITVVFLFRR